MKCDICEQPIGRKYIISIVRFDRITFPDGDGYNKPTYLTKLDVCEECAEKYAALIREEARRSMKAKEDTCQVIQHGINNMSFADGVLKLADIEEEQDDE